MFKRLSHFLQENTILNTSPKGVREGFSTATHLVETVDDFAAVLDERGQIGVIFIDFQEMFDHISHPKLLLKLYQSPIKATHCLVGCSRIWVRMGFEPLSQEQEESVLKIALTLAE